MKRDKHQRKVAAAAGVIILLMYFSVSSFRASIEKNETAIADNNLFVAATNGATLIRVTFDHYEKTLRTTAAAVGTYDDLRCDEVGKVLNEAIKINNFENLGIVFFDGSQYYQNDFSFRLPEEKILQRIQNGETFVTDVLPSGEENRLMIHFFVPITNQEGTPKASLVLSVETKDLSAAIDLTLFDSKGYYHLIDSQGRYAALGDSDNALLMEENFFDAIHQLEYKEDFCEEQILESFTKGRSGYSKYEIEGAERYAYYEPVGINNWVLMTIVPKDVVTSLERQNIYYATKMTIELVFLLFIVFVIVYMTQKKAKKIAVLNDLCFRALAEQTNRIIFEWDFGENSIVSMGNFYSNFGRNMVTNNSPEEALSAQMVHPDDEEAFRSIFAKINSGDHVEEVRFRVKNAAGEYHWCALSGVVVRDQRGKLYKAIGTMEDIEELIQKEDSLRLKSEIDQLTGLFNKVTTEKKIRILLDNTSLVNKCALFIIDIDNFKEVNDMLGHRMGDQVLAQLAEGLKKLSYNDIIVGRIGGDEFFLFYRDCPSVEFVHKKAEEICSIFRKTFSEENKSCKVSASIGVALYPEHAATFEELYQFADIALYTTKENGKDGYTVFDGNGRWNYRSKRTKIDTTMKEQ